MDEDFDIYGDLASIHEDENEIGGEEDEDAKKLKEVKVNLEKELDELRSRLAKLEGQNCQLKTNFSSLIKTAKAEISRKDRTITDLRTKLDNVTFRRNQHRNVEPVLAPPLVTPVIDPLAQYQAIINNKFSYPPPLLKLPFHDQHTNINQFSFPPPPITFSTNDNNNRGEHEEVTEEYMSPVEESIDAESKSDSDDIKVKQEYSKTLYGERLRKKLLDEQENERKQKEAELKSREENTNDMGQREVKKIEIKQEEGRINDMKQQEEQKNKASKEEEKRTELKRQEEKKTEPRQQEEKRNEIRRQEEKKREQRYQEELKNRIKQQEEEKRKEMRRQEEKKNEIRKQEDRRNEMRRQEEQRNKIKQEEDKKNEIRRQEEKKAEIKKEDERRSEIRRQEDKKREQRYQEELKNRIKQQEEEKRKEMRQKEEKKNEMRKQEEIRNEMKRKEDQKNKIRLEEEKKNERRKNEEKRTEEKRHEEKCDVKDEEKRIKEEKLSEESRNHEDVKVKSELVDRANNKENYRSFVNKSTQGIANNLDANKTSDLDRNPSDHLTSMKNSYNMVKEDISSFDEHIGTNGSHISSKNSTNNRNCNDYYDTLRHKDYKNHNGHHYTDNHRYNDNRKNHTTEVSHRHSRRDMYQNERYDRYRSSHKSNDRQRSNSSHHTNRDPSYKQRSKSSNRMNRDLSDRHDRQRSKSSDRTNRDTSDRQRSTSSNSTNRDSSDRQQSKNSNCTNSDPSDKQRSSSSNRPNRDPRIKQDVQDSAAVSTYNRDPRIKQDNCIQGNLIASAYHCNRDPRIKQDDRVDVKFKHHPKDNIREDRSEEKIKSNDNKVKRKKRSKSEEVVSPRKKRQKDKNFIDSMFASEPYEVPGKENSQTKIDKETEEDWLKCKKNIIESDKLSAKAVQVTDEEKIKDDQQNPASVTEANNKNEIRDGREIFIANGLKKDSNILNKTKQENIVLETNYAKYLLDDVEEGEIIDSQQSAISESEDEENLNNRLQVLKNQLVMLENETKTQESDKTNKKSTDQQVKSDLSKSTKIVNSNEGVCKLDEKEKESTKSKNIEKEKVEGTKLYSLLTQKEPILYLRSPHSCDNKINSENPLLSATKSLNHDSYINNKPIEKKAIEKSTSDKPKQTKTRKKSEEKTVMKPDLKEDKDLNDHSTKTNTSVEKTDKTITGRPTQKVDATRHRKIKEIAVVKSSLDTAHTQTQKKSSTNNEIQNKADDILKPEDKKSCTSEKLVDNISNTEKEDNTKSKPNQNMRKNNCTEKNKKDLQSKSDSDVSKQENEKSCPTKKVVEDKTNMEKEENAKSQPNEDAEKNNDRTKQTVKAEKLQSKETQKTGIKRHVSKKQPLKPLVDSEIPAKRSKIDFADAIKTIVPKSQLGKNVIIIRRRRRPVQLADSPPVLVVKNDSLNKSK